MASLIASPLPPCPSLPLLQPPWVSGFSLNTQTCSHLTAFALSVPSACNILPLNIGRAPSLINFNIFAQISSFQWKATQSLHLKLQPLSNPLFLLLIFHSVYHLFIYDLLIYCAYCLFLSHPWYICFAGIGIPVGLIP